MRKNWSTGTCLRVGAALAIFAQAAPACAQAQTYSFDIPSQDLGSALKAFARASHQEITFDANLVRGKRSPALKGTYSAKAALDLLLQGSHLRADAGKSGIFIVRPSVATPGIEPAETASSLGEGKVAGAAAENESAAGEQIVVTGTRIKNAPPVSPVTEITQKQIRESGMTSVGEVIRSLPQNFNGGQNPGISLGSNTNNVNNSNYTGASSINLRGLGPDATLTLLNGHRLSYDSSVQGVDLSLIPVAALKRIEIVADGASAIYGSDAVAGVVNVIMQPDYDGVSVNARLGGSTEGGDFQQQYGIVAGRRWQSGGFIATFDYENDTAINVGQRSYTEHLFRPTTLLAPQRSDSFFFSAHQDVSTAATFSIDALYHHRYSYNIFTTSPPTSPNSTNPNPRNVNSVAVAPKVDFRLSRGWELSLGALYSRDNAIIGSYAGQAPGPYILKTRNCLCNSTRSLEAAADGSVFRLPGGDVRIALGGGYHQTSFQDIYKFPAGTPGYGGSRHSYYVFGEAYLPLLSSNEHIPWIAALSANIAMRYERYNDMGSVATPKLGAKYTPTEDLDLESSWGKSFKAPTLFQEYLTRSAFLYRPATLGGSDTEMGDTVLLMYGGNPDLQPEHATTWTNTISWHPRSRPGLRGEVSYFQIAYNGRVVLPVQPLTIALSNPNDAQFNILNPTIAQVEADIASAPAGLLNLSGYPYDPSTVIAITNDVYTNVVRQNIHGIDVSVIYPFPLAGGVATLHANGTWLVSHQKTTSTSASTPLAGTAFYPPHLRSRDGISWERRGLVLSAFLNYIGGVRDVLVTPNISGDNMITVDLTALYHIARAAGILSDTDVSLAVLNVGNRPPPYLATQSTYAPHFDSTNYSAIGRFVNFSITKHF